MLIKTRLSEFVNRVYRTSHGLIQNGVWVPRHRNVCAVLLTPRGPELHLASNIVTDAGDVYYAQRGAAESPTNAFGIHELASAGTPAKGANRSAFTMIGSTAKAHAATYPQTDDGDTDNTGAGADVVTYLGSYAKADFNHAAISHGIITNTSPGASEPILTGYAFAAPFAKTADDTLKVFVNHTANGV
jgi:hypothetical protein